ncbi:flagella associated protein [Raphidocelis subcapitata]|uniref:Flagella associated protein n=1 Tax=Raphidocelis subcapitata TaxID=307507 RepID=A0A2V0PJ30_9CHLO|nr:flagella associated protein [Raphidocelis subcapitata]|eukprot:GBF97983.1 flagella associated protein [Raphidocelis subcapitata]
MVLDSTKLAQPQFLSSSALATIPAAGAADGGGGAAAAAGRGTARDALTWGGARPPTPEGLLRRGHQHYARQPPGAITRRPGAGLDAPRDGPFGCRSAVGLESAADCLRALPESDAARWRLERAEDVYVSKKREPLGAVPPRGYHLPPGLGTATAFGIDLHVREQELKNSTKQTIFPAAPPEDPAAARLYARTHGSVAPGEQRRREYNWAAAGIDPATHRFGLSGAEASRRRSAQQQASMKQILQPQLDEGIQQPPAVVPALFLDHHLTGDALGRHRLLGGGDRRCDAAAFGAPSAREAEPCVGDLIRSAYPPEQQAPDADLGKSLHEGHRAAPGGVLEAGGGGCQWGGGAAAGAAGAASCSRTEVRQLLAPPASAELGVGATELTAPRRRGEIAALAAEAGLALGEEEFDEVFAHAAAAEGGGGSCSLAAFLEARQELLRRRL